nr:hypothetical protein [Micromonospora sp. DSM 115978]
MQHRPSLGDRRFGCQAGYASHAGRLSHQVGEPRPRRFADEQLVQRTYRQRRADGLRADKMAVYPKLGRERGLVTRTPATGNWPVDSWGTTNTPDYLVA